MRVETTVFIVMKGSVSESDPRLLTLANRPQRPEPLRHGRQTARRSHGPAALFSLVPPSYSLRTRTNVKSPYHHERGMRVETLPP